MNTHELNCDVLVAGGGPAGVPCALAAARRGARVILVHDRPVLGGNASSEVRMHIVGADGSGQRGVPLATETREGGIIEEIRLDAAVRNPQRSASMFDLILYDKCRTQPNLTLMLNTAVVGVEKSGNRIAAAIAERQSTEDRFRITASVFVDCTGDSRMAFEAGAPFMEGRESREQFGEPLAQERADRWRLGSTLLFQARKHEQPMPFVAPPWVRRFTEHDLRFRLHITPDREAAFEYGYWWVEWGGTLDTIKDNEKIRDELLAIMLGVWDFIKQHPSRVAENWALEWFGFLPGKRESRRLIGQYVLREQDITGSTAFDDAIAYGGWPIDTHPPEGVDADGEKPCTQRNPAHLFDIPLRACISRDVPNLMFAGRNLSATHIAFASTRVMATCAVVGQGVGVAAAHAVRRGVDPAALTGNVDDVRAIQRQLIEDDAYLIGRLNDDPADLARSASITASSEQPEGSAVNVVSGQTRSVHGPKGAPPSRAHPGTHRWMSDPAAGVPAWLELRWQNPITPRVVQLVFDTGMHRVLTHSHSDGYVRRMLWGRPQPETVRHYRVQAMVGGKWQTLVEVDDNYRRLRRHLLDSAPATTALRIEVLATHGLDHARICEVRVKEQP